MSTPIAGVDGSEEGRLVRRAISTARRGDAEGIHFLYVRFYDDVLRYVNSLVRDFHEAEDITHNVFAKLMTAITKYEERAVPFTAWIMRVARNAALDHLRARRAVPTEAVRIADEDQADTMPDHRLDIREALEELPAGQREVLFLRHVIGLSPIEIAGTLNRTESSVHGLHHRGRRALQVALESREAVPVVLHSRRRAIPKARGSGAQAKEDHGEHSRRCRSERAGHSALVQAVESGRALRAAAAAL